MINILIVIVLSAIFAILLFNTKVKGIVTLATVVIVGLISSFYAVRALSGNNYDILLYGTMLFGDVPVKIDALSGWFMLVINFTLITGAAYGFNYMKRYRDRKNNISLHCLAYICIQIALLGICSVQNGFVFLLLWEMMSFSVFILVIFESEKPDTIRPESTSLSSLT